MSLELNETIFAMDPAEALRGESGVYEVTSPTGQKFQAVCRPYHSISSFRQIPEQRGLNNAWRIKKVAELRNEAENAAA